MTDYIKPEIENICEMKAETVFAAKSWNPGKGNDKTGTGNSGNAGNQGNGNGKGNGNK